MKTVRTAVYLTLMRHIKDCFFDKAISPLDRIYLIWKVAFFMRIWRTWLDRNGLGASNHFITNNAYMCIELNAHMLLNLVYNIIDEEFSPECFRIWMTGSQSCEQLFRLLRSMTPTFSTIVNFSLKGIPEKMHKLEFVTSSESNDGILFPRLGKRILQMKEETDETFHIPTFQSITQEISKAKRDAIKLAADCGMELTSYNDKDLVKDVEYVVNQAVSNDQEDTCEETLLLNKKNTMDPQVELSMTEMELAAVGEDLSLIKLKKNETPGLPVYIPVEEIEEQ